MLLIHGFTGLPAELRLLGEHLNAQGFTVLAIRLAGHGTTVEDLSRMEHEDWMDSVRDGYAILSGACECVSAVGHSMGAVMHNMALEMLSDFGVVGLIVLMLMFCALLIFILHAEKKEKNGMGLHVVIFGLGFVPSYLTYTSLYQNGSFLFTSMLLVAFCVYHRG